jgi:septum formation protein
MIMECYRPGRTINVVGLPLRSVLNCLLEIGAIGVANA